jgi:hypothetical protein
VIICQGPLVDDRFGEWEDGSGACCKDAQVTRPFWLRPPSVLRQSHPYVASALGKTHGPDIRVNEPEHAYLTRPTCLR